MSPPPTEPDSLANLVTNLNVAKCANAESAYLECTNYALTQLNLPNVAMYLDAGKLPIHHIYLLFKYPRGGTAETPFAFSFPGKFPLYIPSPVEDPSPLRLNPLDRI